MALTIVLAPSIGEAAPMDSGLLRQRSSARASDGLLPFWQTIDSKAIAVSDDGDRVFITGALYSPIANTSPAINAYDAHTGQQLWAQAFYQLRDTIPSDIAVSPDGHKVFVACSGGGAVLAYWAASGAPIWTRPGEISANSVVVNSNGSRIFVTGSRANDYLTIAYDTATGTPL